ncbi:siderophore ABC transporter substrate-binding protein [Amaricoccus sp. W119]|uniref:siderophore ABC transporter substrate-binding protein n=1 Tax=Amaricoccus sp. W119 TaxID=3391833 RepID=UPI0039A6FFC0
MRIALVPALALTLVLPFASVAEERAIIHAQGETAVEIPPARPLVLDINALDIIEALGIEPHGVLGSNLPPYLAGFADDRYVKVGTIFEPDYEAINAAGGDLMIVGGRSASKYPELSRMLPTIDLTVAPENYTESVKHNVALIGEIFGKEAAAEELNAALDKKLATLSEKAATAGTAMILVTNAGKVGVYGPTSRVGWIHRELGFAPVESGIDDRFHQGDVASFEYILEKNPDWLFVIDRDAAIGEAAPDGGAARATLDNELVAGTKAWKEGQVIYLDPAAAYIASGGYTALNTLLDQIAEALDKG